MSVLEQLEGLSNTKVNNVCVSTIYNLIGYFSENLGNKTMNKKDFEVLLGCNINHVND